MLYFSGMSAKSVRIKPTARFRGKHNKWEYDAVKLRLREQLLHEQTPEFKSEYRMRGRIEALNGNLKQNTTLWRLRCRGKTAVYTAIYTIAATHNIMQFFYPK